MHSDVHIGFVSTYSAAEQESKMFFALTSLEIVPNTCISCLYYELPWCKNVFSYVCIMAWKSDVIHSHVASLRMRNARHCNFEFDQLFFAMLHVPAFLPPSKLYIQTVSHPLHFSIIGLLLTLSGDIELNPEPVRFPRGICNRAVKNNQRGLLRSV